MKIDGRVLVIGDVMTDIIVMPDGPLVRGSDRRAQVRSRPGGSGANQAVWLGALGVPVSFIARVGRSDLSFYENYFRGLGVAPILAGDPDLPSGVLVTIVDPDGERSFLTDRGANLNLDAADLASEGLEGIGLLLVSGYSLFETGPRRAIRDLIWVARERGIAIAIDPASTGFLEEVGAENFLAWTSGADLILTNRDEAQVLTGSEDIAEQIKVLGTHYRMVVVKCGSAGAVVGLDGFEVARQAAPAVTVLDSTGAGDAFAAGFIGALCGERSVTQALGAGVSAGARAVGQIGGQPI
jgi:sugar/nucleoside kinase (ribokinase family)